MKYGTGSRILRHVGIILNDSLQRFPWGHPEFSQCATCLNIRESVVETEIRQNGQFSTYNESFFVKNH